MNPVALATFHGNPIPAVGYFYTAIYRHSRGDTWPIFAPALTGISYQPKLTPDGEAGIDVLEAAATGKQFDKKFYETFSRHHYTLLDPLNQCITGSELLHPDLMSLCNQMWHSQTADIITMRRDLARHYAIVDYQPFVAPSGQHTAPER